MCIAQAAERIPLTLSPSGIFNMQPTVEDPMSKPSNWLLQHRHSVTSQLGEDGILQKSSRFSLIQTSGASSLARGMA
ncbi:MAG: hypothetical protein HC818_08000 [Synechococcaceae cyanobacterium RM1_1_27]|nr:hypothetical protein [Synechococcaceae cyanobacterium RM1_1_27]